MYTGGYINYYIKVLRTTDGGANWTNVTSNLDSFHAKYDVVDAIWVSPSDPYTVLVGTPKGIFMSTDGGANWSATPVTSGTRDFVYYPEIDTLYAATSDDGVYMSEDQGVTWQTMNDGLGVMDIYCLDVDRKNGLLFAGSNGGSAWRLSVAAAPLVSDVTEISESTGGMANFTLNATADNAGRNYLLLGSVSGTVPGIPLPGGMATLPLNWDVFTSIVVSLVNTPMFSNFMGTLDSEGKATATWNTFGPLPTGSAGITTYYAYALNMPWNFASNFVEIKIVP